MTQHRGYAQSAGSMHGEPPHRQDPGGVEDHRTPGRPTMDVRRRVEQDDSKFMPRSLEGMGDVWCGMEDNLSQWSRQQCTRGRARRAGREP